MKQVPDLTICSVYHSRETKALLELNREITERLNPDVDLTWIASDGTELEDSTRADDKKFNVVEGIHSKNVPDSLRSQRDFEKFVNSYSHGESLNQMLPHVKTRFVLFLDNDFFIVRPNWIKEMTTHMKKENLAFFGSPFHPRRFDKYRYFPCQQCVCIDLEKIKKKELDYKPDHGKEKLGRVGALRQRIGHKAVRTIFEEKRNRIGKSRDTSHRVYIKHRNKASYEGVVPVLTPRKDFTDASKFTAPAYAANTFNKVVETFLPDQLCYFPKRKGSYTTNGFQELGYKDVRRNGWEEYVWKGKPFGFHMQAIAKRFRRKQLDLDEVLTQVKEALGKF